MSHHCCYVLRGSTGAPGDVVAPKALHADMTVPASLSEKDVDPWMRGWEVTCGDKR